eukprot:gene7771-7969_t
MHHANAVAPLASLEEIGVVEDGEFLDAEAAGGGGSSGPAGRLNPGAATRRSLALSLVSTPGLQHQTPGTIQQPGAGGFAGTGADAECPARPGGFSAGCSGFGGSAGFDGYTPGSFAGITPGAAAAGLPAAGEDDRAGVLQDIDPDDVMMTNQDAAFTQHLPEDLEQQFVEAEGCFYEVLVLGNKGLVKLEQQESYGDIKVMPDLAAMARV